MRRMSSEEDQEVFEITDFTTASDWERFIARIEEIIHEWKLPLHRPRNVLKKGDLSEGKWQEKKEQLMFSNFMFEAVYHHLIDDCGSSASGCANDEDEGEQMPYCLSDMMSKENDFLPKGHCLVRWYGVRDFVIIHPAKVSDAIMIEDRTKMLLSSAFIAINNTNCQIPIFVQLQQMQQKYYLGMCEGGGIRTHFEMVHLHRPFPQYNHLSGLLSLFKSKLSSTTIDVPSVGVSVRLTYILQDLSPYSWPQPPPDIDELGEDITPTDISRLPCGALEDPILEFQLSATWPFLSEDVIIDNDVHSDLDPILAPLWTVRMRTSENPSCSMADYLKEFFVLAHNYESVNQLIGNVAEESDSDSPNITQVLDKLAQPVPPVPIVNLTAILPNNRMQSRNSQEPPLISEEVLIKILQFIFPDSAHTPEDQDSDEYKDTVGSVSDLGNVTAMSKIQEHMRSFKSAPPGSLTWRLALAMCQVNHSYGGLPAVAQLWQDFLLEMRHRWENNYTLPCLEPGPPNMTHCLLHQKLQMLNCCIQRKKAREWHQIRRSKDSIDEGAKLDNSLLEGLDSSLTIQTSESDEDEFFECRDNSSSTSLSHNETKTSKIAEGRLRKFGEVQLLNSEEPLFIPITQEPAPVTEDLLEEQAEVLVQLGTHPEGAALRARMQSACLTSDMEAFKAANPNSVLEDFVRWYSPRDLVEEEVKDETTGKTVTQYHLSARMLLPGNMWLEAWENSKAVPAKRQKRLFDDTKEAEKVLHFLASARTTDVITNLMPMIVHCSILQLAEEAEESPQALISKLEETALKTIKVTRSAESKYEGVLRCLYEAEVIVAQLQSACKKFGLEDNEVPLRRDSVANRRISISDTITSHSLFDRNKDAAATKNKAIENAEILKFILNLMDSTEIEVPGAGKGIVGKRIRHLFSEAQRASHMILDEKPLAANATSQNRHTTVKEFPPPFGKEFILRTTMARPSLHSTVSPQRMYCVLKRDEFRLAGAFSSDTTFF